MFDTKKNEEECQKIRKVKCVDCIRFKTCDIVYKPHIPTPHIPTSPPHELNRVREPKTWAYCRVSTTEQNLDRQHDEIKNSGVHVDYIIDEKQSGKSFSERKKYLALRNKMRKGDLLVILSIDRLGRNYQEILDEWRYLTETKKIDIQVLDMPTLNTRNGVGGLDGKFIRRN